MFSTYQILGLKKLIEFKPFFSNTDTGHISFKAALDVKNIPVQKEKVDEFTNLFCEHQLADTDYSAVQHDAIMHQLPIDYIEEMHLAELLKLLTYIIWTDKILQGYFYARIHDHTLYIILSRIEKLLDF